MINDGSWKFTFSGDDVAFINNFTYQALPWLQTTFRYSIFDPNDIGKDDLKDRSFGIKTQIFEENRYIPQVSIGIRDFLGTGTFSSEYLVASKKFNNFDVSVGLGWGRLSDRSSFDNPLGKLNSHLFKRQIYSGGELGGELRLRSIFRGESVGTFGGVTYSLDDFNLKFHLEYNSDEYKREQYFGTMESNSPVNFGIEWEPITNTKFGISYKYGNQLGLSISSQLDTKYTPKRKSVESFYSSYDLNHSSKISKSINFSNWYEKLLYDVEMSGLRMNRASLTDDYSGITIEISNIDYVLMADAINRFLILANLHLPKIVRNINLIINEDGFKVTTINFKRRDSEFSIIDDRSINILRARNIDTDQLNTIYSKKLNIGYNLASRFQLFSASKSLKYQVYGSLNASYRLREDLFIFTSIAYDLKNNFFVNQVIDSALPPVRTEIDKYLTQGRSGIDSLFLEKRSNFNSNTYYRVYAGILEQMFSGVGVEILYNQFRKRWALGATVNHVRKRNYNRSFELLDYTTTTSYLSLYYASPFYNYDFALHLGRYLAKDTGATIEVRRTFDNGFSIGIFASSTNVSKEDFGEGSFDKGINFSVPMDFFTKNNNKYKFTNTLRSVQRDGGQRMDGFSGTLWFDLRDVRYDSLMNHKDRMIDLL